MRLTEQVAQSFQFLLEHIKIAIVYLQAHPLVHYMIITTILIVTLLLLISLRKKNEAGSLEPADIIAPIASNQDLNAIAGDDVIATQLDLAKAYIEMDQKKLAQSILQQALKQGSEMQQQEARQLLTKTL